MDQLMRSEARTLDRVATTVETSPPEPTSTVRTLPESLHAESVRAQTMSGLSGDGPGGQSDLELVCRVRRGDSEAFGLLYRRHVGFAMACSRRLSNDPSATEDLCHEAFARLLSSMRNGHGPSSSVRAYLRATIQSVSRLWAERDRMARAASGIAGHRESGWDPLADLEERSLTLAAFAALSERWRKILQYTLLDGLTPPQIAPMLGIDALAVSALAYRAREGLRQAYLQSHISQSPLAACRPFSDRLGAYTRGRVGARERTHIYHHLTSCVECARLFATLRDVNERLVASQSVRRRLRPRTFAALHGGPPEPRDEEYEVPFADSLARCRFERHPRRVAQA